MGVGLWVCLVDVCSSSRVRFSASFGFGCLGVFFFGDGFGGCVCQPCWHPTALVDRYLLSTNCYCPQVFLVTRLILSPDCRFSPAVQSHLSPLVLYHLRGVVVLSYCRSLSSRQPCHPCHSRQTFYMLSSHCPCHPIVLLTRFSSFVIWSALSPWFSCKHIFTHRSCHPLALLARLFLPPD